MYSDAELPLAEHLQDRYNSLLVSHERYRMMFDHIPLAYMSMNENAAIIDFNNGFSELTGYSHEEVFLKPFAFFLYDAKDIEYHVNITFPRFKRLGYARNQPWKLKHKSGREIYVMVHGNVRYDHQGNFIQTHCLIVDVTEQHQAREECQRAESKAQLILDVISERVTFHDRNHQVLWANKIARNSTNGDCVPQERHCVNGQNSCDKCPVSQVFSTHKPAFGEVFSQGRLLHVSAYPVLENQAELSGVVQVARDITERRNLEKELLRLSTNERQRLGGDLHDGLGQELTGLSLLASALANQLKVQNSGESELADKIVASVGRARKRMYNVLQGLCHVPDGADGLSRALAGLQQSTAELFAVECQLQDDGLVRIHDSVVSSHLYHIASEAVNNALKYSHCQRLAISLSRVGKVARLVVTDNGQGFCQSQLRSGAMGLKIMQYRASMMAGELNINSDSSGTTICCEVPLESVDIALQGVDYDL